MAVAPQPLRLPSSLLSPLPPPLSSFPSLFLSGFFSPLSLLVSCFFSFLSLFASILTTHSLLTLPLAPQGAQTSGPALFCMNEWGSGVGALSPHLSLRRAEDPCGSGLGSGQPDCGFFSSGVLWLFADRIRSVLRSGQNKGAEADCALAALVFCPG